MIWDDDTLDKTEIIAYRKEDFQYKVLAGNQNKAAKDCPKAIVTLLFLSFMLPPNHLPEVNAGFAAMIILVVLQAAFSLNFPCQQAHCLFFRLVICGSLRDIIKWHFVSPSPTRLLHGSCCRLFAGKHYNSLHMITIVQTTSHIFLFLIRLLFQHFYRIQIVFFYITKGSGFIFLIFICCLINSLLMRDTPISLQ